MNFMVEVLRETGARLIEAQKGPCELDFKGRHSDVVTSADRMSEQLLMSAIRKACPRDAILSEESDIQAGSSDYTWVIDPLDGTANFAAGMEEFGIIVGRLRGSEPVFGAMYLPFKDALYVAERGAGAARNDEAIQVCAERDLSAVLIDHSFHFRDDPHWIEREVRAFRQLWPHVRGVRSFGCLVYLAQVAEGKLGGFVANDLGLWDLAGPAVILEEAGANVTDLMGRPVDLSWTPQTWKRSLSAVGANPALHAELLAKIKPAHEASA